MTGMARTSITASKTTARPISTLSCPDQATIKANSSPAVTVCQAGPEARSRQMTHPAVIKWERSGNQPSKKSTREVSGKVRGTERDGVGR